MNFIDGVICIKEVTKFADWIIPVCFVLCICGYIILLDKIHDEDFTLVVAALLVTGAIAIPITATAGIIPNAMVTTGEYEVKVVESQVNWEEFHKLYNIVDYESGVYIISLKDTYDAAKIDAAE